MQWLAIAFGGALGAVARHASVGLISDGLGKSFPFATLGVNASGSFLAGLLAWLWMGKFQLSPEWHGFLVIGFLGGFTTFSAFSIENVQLIQSGELAKAMAYMLASLVICVGAAGLGMALAAVWFRG